MSRPRIMLDVRWYHATKIVGLANRHKLGWIILLCEAKLQDREGVFGSPAGLRLSAAEFRDCIPTWLEAGLLHHAAAMCAKCVKTYGVVPETAVVVHDWHDYQMSRTTMWREDPGTDLEQPVKHSRNKSETPSETEVEPLARASRGSRSRSSSGSSSSEGIQGEPDELPTVIRWLAERRIAVIEGTRPHTDLARLVDQHGGPVVIEAMAGLPGPLHDGPQYVYGARNELNPIPSGRNAKAKGYGPDKGEVNRAFRTA